MTAPLHTEATARSFRSPSVFRSVVVATLGITVVAAATALPEHVSIGVVIAVVAVLGIPHGALDHLVADAIDGGHDAASRRRFLGRYVIAMAAVGVVWLVAPPIALATFLLLSVHHFGQSDLAHLRIPGARGLTLQWSRGLFLVGLPLVAHLRTVAPVIERLGGGDPTNWPWLSEAWVTWSTLIVLQHVVIGALIVPEVSWHAARRQAVSVGVLTSLFLATDPLVGFAVYFGLWHSFGHLLALADVLDAGHPRSLVRLAAPMTAISLGALAVTAGGLSLTGRLELFVPAVFVGVSMLTVPHMVVVERLWRSTASSSDAITPRLRSDGGDGHDGGVAPSASPASGSWAMRARRATKPG
jgi:beta-carotene 15,15'-dioxygenase